MVFCDICNTVASTYCHSCKLYLCNNHSQVHHASAVTSTHSMIPIELEPSQQNQPSSNINMENTSSQFQQAAMAKGNLDLDLSPQQIASRCNGILVPKLQSAKQDVEEERRNVESRASCLRTEIQSQFSLQLQKLREAEADILQHLEKISVNKQNTLSLQAKYLDDLLKSVVAAVDKVNLISKNPTHQQFSDSKDEQALLQSKLRAMEKGDLVLQPIEDDGIDLELSFPDPFISVENTYPCASNSIAQGYGLLKGRVGFRSTFTIVLKDQGDKVRKLQPRDSCPVLVVIKQSPPGAARIPATIFDNNNGTYMARFVPEVSGCYTTSVLFNGLPIKSSPFSLEVSPADLAIPRNPNIRNGQRHVILICSGFLRASNSNALPILSDRRYLEENEIMKVRELTSLIPVVSALQAVVLYALSQKSRQLIISLLRDAGYTCQELVKKNFFPCTRSSIKYKFHFKFRIFFILIDQRHESDGARAHLCEILERKWFLSRARYFGSVPSSARSRKNAFRSHMRYGGNNFL